MSSLLSCSDILCYVTGSLFYSHNCSTHIYFSLISLPFVYEYMININKGTRGVKSGVGSYLHKILYTSEFNNTCDIFKVSKI